VVGKNLLDVSAATFKQINHGLVGGTGVSTSVARDVLFEERLENVGLSAKDVLFPFKRLHLLDDLGLVSWVREFFLVNIDRDVTANIDVSNLHLVESKSTGLVRANVISATHDFARGETLHIVMVSKHALNGVGERDHDGKRETLGHGDDNNGNTDDDVVNNLLDELDEGVVLAEEVDGAADVALNEESEEEHVDGQESGVGTHKADIGGDFLELVLEGGDFGADLELLDDLAEARVITNHEADHFTFALGHTGAGHHQGGGEVVLAGDLSDGGLVHVSFLLMLHAEALGSGLLLDFIGLTGHSGFVAQELGGEKQKTVDGDGHTVLNHDNVTDVEVVVVDFHLLTFVTEDIADVSLVGIHAGFDKLDFFLPVDERADTSDDHDGHKNSSTLNPGVLTLVRSGQHHIEGDGEDGANKENLEHEIVKGFPENLPEGLSLEGIAHVVTEVRRTVWTVHACEAFVNVDVEESGECFAALVVPFDADEIFIIGTCLVCLNEIDKLLLRDLEFASSPLRVFNGGTISLF